MNKLSAISLVFLTLLLQVGCSGDEPEREPRGDGDSRDELVLGLGNEPSEASIPGGLFQVLDETHAHLAWGEIDWQAYNAANGESYPATGDNDGDGQEEIIIGLGPKRMEAAQDSSPEPASMYPGRPYRDPSPCPTESDRHVRAP